MISADEARRKASQVRSSIENTQEESRKKQEERIEYFVQSMLPGVRASCFRVISEKAEEGKMEVTVGINEYVMSDRSDSNRAIRIAYERVMKELEQEPYGYRVKNKSSEGYDGEGNNMQDFYVHHEWTISW